MQKLSTPLLISALISATFVSACGGNNADSDGPGEEIPEEELEPGIDSSANSPLTLIDADLLFEAESIPSFEISLPPEDWEQMQNEALEEEYFQADLLFEGANMGSVGLRFKGARGSLELCLDSEGNLICPKLGMKIKFSREYKDKRFYGMKRLNFHGMSSDESKLVERIGYRLFRDMGIDAPRSNWAVLKINGESLGLFSLVEQVDGRFTENRWPKDGDGNLYKETWPLSSDEQWYQEGLKTNEDTATHDKIIAFHEDMAKADEDELLATLEQWTDSSDLATYLAVDDALSNWDGITSWYNWGDFYASHNHYWYQHDEDDRFTLIPWDLDNVLWPYIPTGEVPHWTSTPEDCEEGQLIWGNVEVKAPGCDPILRAVASKRRPYNKAIDRLLEGPFELDTLYAQIDEYAAYIHNEVEADPTTSSVVGWVDAVADLKNSLHLGRLKLEALRQKEKLISSTVSLNNINDFENLKEYSVMLGIGLYSNPSSSVSRRVNTEDALFGTQDIRIDFSYRDEAEQPWGQWGSYIFHMKEGLVDLRPLQGLRLHLRSGSSSRDVWIALESHESSQADEGIRFGWTVEATDSSTVIEVLFSEARLPSWAPVNDDVLEDVLATVHAVALQPQVIQNSGYLGEGVHDADFVQVDNIEFF